MKTVYWLGIGAALFGVFAFFFFWFALTYLKKSSEERKKTEIILKTKPKSRKLYKAYKFFVEFKPTRRYIQKLQRMYEIRIPGDIRRTRENAAKLAMIIWSIDIVAFLFLVFTQPSLLTWVTVLYTVYVISDQIVQKDVNRLDLQLITELSTFIDDVRHQYFVHGMVDESIESALEKAPPLMKQHGQRILDIIQSEDMIDELEKYCAVVPSYYLKMFADTCSKITQYGDKDVDDQSLFLMSIQSLKEEIQMEQLRQNGLTNKFKFLIGITVIPVYVISPLEGFGVSGFSALKDLFRGSYGIWATIFTFLSSFAAYKIVGRLRSSVHVDLQDKKGWRTLYNLPPVKKVVNNFLAKNWGKTLRKRDLLKKTGSSFDVKTFTTRCFVYFVATLMISVLIFVAASIQTKRIAGSNVTAVASTTSGASDDECFEMLLIARQLLEDYKDYDARKAYNVLHSNQKTMKFDSDVAEYLSEEMLAVINEEGVVIDEALAYSQVDAYLAEHESSTSAMANLQGLSYEQASQSSDAMVISGFNTFENLLSIAQRTDNKMTDDEKQVIVDETVKQIKKYQNAYFHWYDLLISLIFAVIAYNVPTWVLLFEKKALQMDMEDEVIQYKSAIMLLMNIDRMTTDVILESMLMIANIFKQSIQKCINNMPLNEDKAYDQLEEDEPFDAFKRMVENLRMVDKVGVHRAFSTVTSERKNYQEKRKQENEISVSEKGALANFISMIPAYVVIVAFMVAPYIIEAISEFSHALSDMQTYM